jgi:hypothetical protein
MANQYTLVLPIISLVTCPAGGERKGKKERGDLHMRSYHQLMIALQTMRVGRSGAATRIDQLLPIYDRFAHNGKKIHSFPVLS